MSTLFLDLDFSVFFMDFFTLFSIPLKINGLYLQKKWDFFNPYQFQLKIGLHSPPNPN